MTIPADPYPRSLNDLETDLIRRVLPERAPGHARHREFIASSVVIGQGRRGEGEIIMGKSGDIPDLDAPLPSVFAYGVARAEPPSEEEISVTVREILDGQLSIEVVGQKNDLVDPGTKIGSFWSYSTWRPGLPCPQCGSVPREAMVAKVGPGPAEQVLAICRADRRLWIYDGGSQTCRPVPVTNYYNELMLLKQIRDPEIALSSEKFFERLDDYGDGDLTGAFLAYNRVRTKIDTPAQTGDTAGGEGTFRRILKKIFPGG